MANSSKAEVSSALKAKKSLCTRTEENEIRLVKVCLGDQGQLEIKLERTTFAKAPTYEALSYSWGVKPREEDEFSVTIQCLDCDSSHPLGLWPNLHLALTRIVSHSQSGTGQKERTLWTDRICIDQEDEEDKAVQVAQMPKVYSTAQRVLVWLGDPPRNLKEPDLQASLDRELLFDVAEKVSNLISNQVGKAFNPLDPAAAQAAGLPLPGHAVWKLWSDVVRRDWYKRMWTLQETVLAKELIFHYGTRILTWDRIVRLAEVYQQASRLKDRDDEREGGTRWRWDHVVLAFQYRNMMQQSPPQPIQFSHLLQTSMYKDCTMDKDRVYGVLGMTAENVQEAVKSLDNYNKPLRRIYVDAFHQVLKGERALQFLSLPFECGIGADTDTDLANRLPTWCPDLRRWNGCQRQFQLPRRRRKWAEYPVSLHVDDNDRLHVLGVVADTIAAVSPHVFPDDSIRDPERRWRLIATFYRESLAMTRAAAAAAATTADSPTNTDDPVQIHWRTLIVNRHGQANTISSSDAERGYRNYFRTGKEVATVRLTEEENRLAHLYSSHVLAACRRRRFFRSTGGRVGLAPDTCQVGDIICVFQGAVVPYLLRRNVDADDGSSSTFSFLGECYVHGLMEAEIVDRFDDGLLQAREFLVT